MSVFPDTTQVFDIRTTWDFCSLSTVMLWHCIYSVPFHKEVMCVNMGKFTGVLMVIEHLLISGFIQILSLTMGWIYRR